MKNLLRYLIVGIILFISGNVYAGEYRVLVIPDNIVTENVNIDSYIYNETAEFFANEIITLLNGTDNIKAPSVSETRSLYKKNTSTYLMTKKLTDRFRTSYNVDSITVKKLANKSGCRYVLLLTSYTDHENYVLRRTFWDFLNIPGATVVDPAYKISTYAVLYDTQKNSKIWSDTYYKTISICENRIITRGPSPQVEQLEKIRDYSRSLCPQIARNIQLSVLPVETLATESRLIVDDMGNLDNVFTKKYRQYIKSTKKKLERKDTQEKPAETEITSVEKKIQDHETKATQTKLEVKAQPVQDTTINTTRDNSVDKKINNAGLKTEKLYSNTNTEGYSINLYGEQNFDIKKSKTNSLINNTRKNPPSIRNYSL